MRIARATHADIKHVIKFCQPIYQATYPNDKYGVKPEYFDPWVFQTKESLAYFSEVMRNDDTHAAFLATEANKIIGTISIVKQSNFYEVRCFYVARNHRHKGLGKKLWSRAMGFKTRQLPIRVLVGETLTDAIAMYEKWGFRNTGEILMYHWPEWPAGVENAYYWYEKPA